MNDVRSEAGSARDAWMGEFTPEGELTTNGAGLRRPGVRRHAIARIERSAHRLGWFSVGLGVTQLVAPRALARAIGVGGKLRHAATMRALGLRELTAGIGILSRRRPAGWMWARVAGDIMDLALLANALRGRRRSKLRILQAIGAVAGVTALDYLTARQLGRHHVRRISPDVGRAVHVTKTMTIARSAEDLYRMWRDFRNLPQFMVHLESIEVQSERRSRWTAIGPAGKRFTWQAEITQDRPNELIAWKSLPGASVPSAGVVRFLPAPGGRGTEVRVDMKYDPPAGLFGASIAKLFGKEPGQQVEGDLRRFKQVMETGEVTNSDASIHRGPHPARPPSEVPARVRANMMSTRGEGR